jgi:hypothetical protein
MMRPLLGVLIALLVSLPAVAQEREIERSTVPRDLADRLIGIANDPGTARFQGETTIPSDSVVPGDVVVLGSLRLGGRVGGELIVVEGDVDLGPASEVVGDLTVVGGEVRGDELAHVGGTLMAFGLPRAIPVNLADRVSTDERGLPNGIRGDFGREGSTRFTLDAATFNRLEGLSITAGPAFSTGGRNPFRAHIFVIWRSEGRSPFQNDRLGYRVEMEQLLLGRRELRIGAGLFSRVEPIESWGLTDQENSWSAFLFTNDQRDHLEVRGGRAFVRVTPRHLPVDLTVELRDERSGVVAPGDPWSVVSRDRPWRQQPLVSEGSLRSLVAQIRLDTRDDRYEPGAGWLVQAVWQEELDGALTLPEVTVSSESPQGTPTLVGLPEITSDVSRAFLDVRRYNTVGRGTYLNLRGVIGGSARGAVLAPQFQHTLGGPGSLPGHPAFAADCGARGGLVSLKREGVERTMYPFYGCDRFALFQAEYRGSLGNFLGLGSSGHRRGRESDPRWVVFFDAGRAWADGDWGDFSRPDSSTLYDAGLGVLVGGLGI